MSAKEVMIDSKKEQYILKIEDLCPGDIIMEKGEERFSQIYNQRYGTPYTHAKLYIGDGEYIDADGLTVKSQQVLRTLYQHKDDAIILRCKEKLSILQQSVIEAFARSEIGKEFHMPAKVYPIAKSDDTMEKNREYCVRLVATAYEAAGVKIVETPLYCAPKDIIRSDRLHKLDIELSLANKQDEEYANSTCVINNQEDVIWNLFAKIRNVTSADIQTEEQFVIFLLAHPEYDDIVYESIKDDQYFTMLEDYHKDHPEEYNAKLLLDKYKENAIIKAYIVSTHAHDMQMGHWGMNLQTYKILQETYKLKTFSLFVNLYQTLNNDCERRKIIFMEVMSLIREKAHRQQ